jgi:hypothetical protein
MALATNNNVDDIINDITESLSSATNIISEAAPINNKENNDNSDTVNNSEAVSDF